MPDKDFLRLHLRDLPFFRALIRAVEAEYYQSSDLPAPTLDLGCGDGHFASLAFNRSIDVGLDPWHTTMHEARKRGIYRMLVEADGSSMPFQDGCFASAFSNSVLEHILDIDRVLNELGRVLHSGAPFHFCVPNERYLSQLYISRFLGKGYIAWFRRMSRVQHADPPGVWVERLERAGFHLEEFWHYFPPASMRMLEFGHYLGLPSLLVRVITGRWILVPSRWNLWMTEKLLRRYVSTIPAEDGAFTFYITRRR